MQFNLSIDSSGNGPIYDIVLLGAQCTRGGTPREVTLEVTLFKKNYHCTTFLPIDTKNKY